MRKTPEIVERAFVRARESGFSLSSKPEVGSLLSVLSGNVKRGGRILEIGTGVGVGTSWIVSGLDNRTDVEVITVDVDSSVLEVAMQHPWAPWVSFRNGDILGMYQELGQFDLIFADAQGGKWEGLELTIHALKPGALLLVDDMTPPTWNSANHELQVKQVKHTLLSHPDLVSCELSTGTGIILSSRRF